LSPDLGPSDPDLGPADTPIVAVLEEVIATPKSMPAVIGLPREEAAVEGGTVPPLVAPRRQGWRALFHRRHALCLHRHAALGLRGGDRRRKAWSPSTAGASRAWPPSTTTPPQASVVVAAVRKPLASLRYRRAPGLPPPPSRAWSPSIAAPPLNEEGMRSG
jgi:hypothetical protein